jgi:cell division initiation protein
MAVTPNEVEHVEFGTTRMSKGYDPDEVDAFLDRVAEAMRAMERQINDLDTKLRAKTQEVARLTESPTAVISPVQQPQTPTRILELAQETHDKLVSEAKQSAEEIVKAAGDESNRIRYRAEQDAQTIVGEASKDADNRRSIAEEKMRYAERQLATLETARDNLRAFLDTTLTQTIASIDSHNPATGA